MFIQNDFSLIVILALGSLLPFVIAAGTCFIKFSIVFSLIRNAIGLQQVPSNMTLQAIALMMAAFVMTPVIERVYERSAASGVEITSAESMKHFVEYGLVEYKEYLHTYSDKEILTFFGGIHARQHGADESADVDVESADQVSIFALLPAYALSEIKSAFQIGFYVYLPFIVVDLIVSNILLALGMMMMSPVTISLPIKLILFVAVDGWTKVVQGLILQYAAMWK